MELYSKVHDPSTARKLQSSSLLLLKTHLAQKLYLPLT